MMPSILVSSMALIGFLIPHNSGEKISMYTTMMLSMSVYLTTITKFVPPASETSIVGTNGCADYDLMISVSIYTMLSCCGCFAALFYTLSLIMVSCITAMNMWTMNLNDRTWHNRAEPSAWVRKWILGYMAWCLRIPTPNYGMTQDTTDSLEEDNNFVTSTSANPSASHFSPPEYHA